MEGSVFDTAKPAFATGFVLLTGLATVLLASACISPYWQSTQYPTGVASIGLWQRAFESQPQPPLTDAMETETRTTLSDPPPNFVAARTLGIVAAALAFACIPAGAFLASTPGRWWKAVATMALGLGGLMCGIALLIVWATSPKPPPVATAARADGTAFIAAGFWRALAGTVALAVAIVLNGLYCVV